MRLLRSIVRTVFIVLLLIGWSLAAAALHVVRLPEGAIGLVPKDHLTLTDTYVDVRNWTPADAAQHPALVARLVESHKADWLGQAVGVPGATLDAKLDDLLKGVTADPTTKPAHAVHPTKAGKGPH